MDNYGVRYSKGGNWSSKEGGQIVSDRWDPGRLIGHLTNALGDWHLLRIILSVQYEAQF
jgi:hypothetical protein